MSLLILVLIIGLPIIILMDSKKRLGKYSWGWALFTFVGLIGIISQIGKQFGSTENSAPQFSIAIVIGSILGVYAGGFAFYRAMSSSSSQEDTRNMKESDSEKILESELKETKANDLYIQACNYEVKGEIKKAKELFNQFIDNNPDSPDIQKAKLHLLTLINEKPKGIPVWIFFIALYFIFQASNSSTKDTENLFFYFAACVELMILNWAWLSWKSPAIDDVKGKISSASGWLWLIGVLNTIAGFLIINEIITAPLPVEDVPPSFLLWLGIIFIIIAIIVLRPNNSLAPLALTLAIVVWGMDTAIMVADIIFSGFQVAPFIYFMLFFHFIALSSMTGGLSGFSADNKLQTSVSTPKSLLSDMDNEIIEEKKRSIEYKTTPELLILLNHAESKEWKDVTIEPIKRALHERGELPSGYQIAQTAKKGIDSALPNEKGNENLENNRWLEKTIITESEAALQRKEMVKKKEPVDKELESRMKRNLEKKSTEYLFAQRKMAIDESWSEDNLEIIESILHDRSEL